MKSFTEKVRLCPVVILTNMMSDPELGFGVDSDNQLQAVARVKCSTHIKPRVNPIALVARTRGNIQEILYTSKTKVSLRDAEDSDTNPLREMVNRAFSEAIIQHLGSNCISCVFAEHCSKREELAKQAHHPELSYEEDIHS